MSERGYKIATRVLWVVIAISSIVLVLEVILLLRGELKETAKQALRFPQFEASSEIDVAVDLTTQQVELTAIVGKSTEYTIPEGYTAPQALPVFITNEINTRKLIITPTNRSDIAKHLLNFIPINTELTPELVLQLNVVPPPVDIATMEAEIMALVGAGNPHVGIYIEDLIRGKTYTYNASHQYKPGSLSKLPVGFVTLADLQSGKLTLNSTFPVYNQYKHTYVDNIGKLAAGTRVTIDTYLTELYRLSSNTAQYHLREMIGNPTQASGVWSSGVLNQRVQEVLGVWQWGEDPHIVTGLDIGKVFGDLYRGKLLNDQWRDYFYDRLGSAVPSLKEAIPAGVPAGIKTVNKVGFLYGGSDNVYNDAAIVFGEQTDYIIAILNSAAPPYPQGKTLIRTISSVVYRHLN